LVLIGIFSASANLFQVLPAVGNLENWAVFSLGGGASTDDLSDSAYIAGDVSAAGNGNMSLSGNAVIDGNLYCRSNGNLEISGDARITGARYYSEDLALDDGANEAFNFSNAAFALPRNRSYRNIRLRGARSTTVVGAPGETVVLTLRNFSLTGNTTFILRGTATTMFIINVRRQFSLSGNARIVLSGGVQWDDVLFNVRGKSRGPSLSGNASLQGILMANERIAGLSDNSIVTGEVIADAVTLRGASQIIHPPVASP
jgi:hypothetical protein